MEAPIRFASYELDPVAGELRKGGVRVPLAGQPLDVLALLASRPGEAVTREELKQALWPDETFVDFDNGVNSAIRRIRRALDDSATNPRFIETLPKRGYRFIAPVIERPVPPSAIEDDTRTRARRGRAWTYFAGAFAAAVLLAWVLWPPANPDAPPRPMASTVRPLTTLPGFEQHPSLSPDGSQVAFSWNGSDREGFDIYVQSVDGGQFRQLTDDKADEIAPAWSPDGQWIAFWRVEGESSGVYLISPVGGAARKLFNDRPDPGRSFPNRYQLSWSADSSWVAFTDSASEPARVTAVSTGGEERALTDPPDDADDVEPHISPDGERLLWTRLRKPGSTALFSMRLPSGKPTLVRGGFGGWLAWTPDSRYLIMNGEQRDRLVAFDVSTGAARVIPDTLSATQPVVAADGSRLAFARGVGNTEALRVDVRPGSMEPASFRPFFSSTQPEFGPAISPGGRRVAMTSWRSGERGLWTVGADGSGAMLMAAPGFAPRWSPDGRRIAFDGPIEGDRGYGVWTVDADGGTATLQTDEDAFAHQPCWSSDGGTLYFGRRVDTGIQLFRKAVSGEGETSEVSHGEAARCWASEGWIYFGRGADVIRAPEARTSEQEVVLEGRLFPGCAHWQVLNGRLYFIDFEEGMRTGRWTLKRMDLASRNIQDVVELPREPRAQNGLSVAPDETWFLYTVKNSDEQDLYLIDGFDWRGGE